MTEFEVFSKHRKSLGHRNFLSHSQIPKNEGESQHFSMLKFLDGHSY